MNEVPAAFDWVRARHECSLECVFQTLREVVDSDVKRMMALKNKPEVGFRLSAPAADKFIVTRARDYGGGTEGSMIVFELLPTEIRVRDGRDEKTILSAKPDVNPEGECLLEVQGKPY